MEIFLWGLGIIVAIVVLFAPIGSNSDRTTMAPPPPRPEVSDDD